MVAVTHLDRVCPVVIGGQAIPRISLEVLQAVEVLLQQRFQLQQITIIYF